jgi:hypothetical protein
MRTLPFLLAGLILVGAGCSPTTEVGDLAEDGVNLAQIATPNPPPPTTNGVPGNNGLYGVWRLESYTRTIASSTTTFAHQGRTLTLSPNTSATSAATYVVANWMEDYGTEIVETGGTRCTFSGTRTGTMDMLPQAAGDIVVSTLRFHLTDAQPTPKGTCEYPGGNPNGAAGQVQGTVASPSVNPNGINQDYAFTLSGDMSTLTLTGTLAPTPMQATMVWKRVQ